MNTKTDYREEIINLTKDLPLSELKEVAYFIKFLIDKGKELTYQGVGDSAKYVQEMRVEETKRIKSGKEFIEELIRWQKSEFL